VKNLISILLIVLLSLTLGGCGVKTEAKPSKNEVSAKETSTKVESKKVLVTVTKEDRTKEDKWDELEDGKELVLLYVKIVNNTDKEIQFNPTDITIETSAKTLYDSDKKPKGEETLSLKHIASGETLEGIIPYEINVGETYKTYYKSDRIN